MKSSSKLLDQHGESLLTLPILLEANMKKIPTLFERIYNNHKVVGITPNVTPGCEKALTGARVIEEGAEE